MSESVKTFYEKSDGTFGLVDIDRLDKARIDNLIALLKKLGIHHGPNRDNLLNTWKQYDRTNVRKYRS